MASNGKLCHRYFTPIEMDYRSPLIQKELARRAERLGHSPCENAAYNPLTGQSGAGAFVNPFAGVAAIAQQPAAPAATGQINCTTTTQGVFTNTSCRGL